ncbi:MAG: acetyl-CoA carboxylase biotin carboxylase subunit [candidate division WOR-3 bacterium]|uniref:Acetyl-CoA carboxylase biotin carboxylase subunit n=2 Tax=candidate division WOR-3 bacterium TaxID=2052148 RepID=A0A7V4E351_UNCW3
MIKKVLIANRGEIAIRIAKTLREMGVKTVSVYSDADKESLHIRKTDETYYLGPSKPSESYLNIEKIIEIAKKCKADAIHPGYGFLAENPKFAKECEKNGIIFIGPSSESLEKSGDKIFARKAARECGVNIIPGSEVGTENYEEFEKMADEIGYPLIIKAALGGGGKGMRIVEKKEDLKSAFELARKEALEAFADGTLYVEKYLKNPRHIEIQIMGDKYKNYIHLFERECSIQRRHQKIIEEAPSPFMDENLRKNMSEAAIEIAKKIGYYNAGTIEFLVDENKNFYFLEINARLQVEHPVTEMITGKDLVRAQIQIASGEKIPWKKEEINLRGHAIECRIYAEDPLNNFAPSPGKIEFLSEPKGPYVRVDSGIYEGWEIPLFYDPLISKLIVWSEKREESLQKMREALKEYIIIGVKTIIPFLLKIIQNEDFKKGNYHTNFLKEFDIEEEEEKEEKLLKVAILGLLLENKGMEIKTKKESYNAWKIINRLRGLY